MNLGNRGLRELLYFSELADPPELARGISLTEIIILE